MKTRIVVSLVVIGGLVGAGGWWFWQQRAAGEPQYQTATVTRGDLTQVVTATGQINPVVNVQVGSQISGIIQKLFVDFNSPVTAGQVIAQIDPATYQANRLQAEADLASARAALELANVKARRARELLAQQLIPQSDFDQVAADLHQTEAAVKTREAALARAQIDLARCTITAPVDGIVISRSVDVGQTVAASLSAPTLFQIANDLTRMQINAYVAEADIGRVEAGQEVEFTVDAFPQRTFRGQVAQVRNAPTTVQNVVTYDTMIAVHNADLQLKPGMTANVSIIITRRSAVLRLPNAALRFRLPDNGAAAATRGRRTGGASRTRTVYRLVNGQPEPVAVQTGISDGIHTEVLDGLQEQDLVITALTQPVAAAAPPATNPLAGGSPHRRF